MDAICDMERTKEFFEESWEKYVFVIINYALSHTFQSKDLRHALRDLSQEDIDSLEDGEYLTSFVRSCMLLGE